MNLAILALLSFGAAVGWGALALLTYALFRSKWWGVFE